MGPRKSSSSSSEECCDPPDTYNIVQYDEFDYEVVRSRPKSCCVRPAVSPCVLAAVVFGAIIVGIIGGGFLVWFVEDYCVAGLPPVAVMSNILHGRSCIRTALIYPKACYDTGVQQKISPAAISSFISGAKTWAAQFNGQTAGYTASVVQKSDYSTDLIIVANSTAPTSCIQYSGF